MAEASQQYKKTFGMAAQGGGNRKRLICLFVLLGGFLSAYFALNLPVTYTATAKIFFAYDRAASLDNHQDAQKDIGFYDLQAQMEMMRSPALIKEVVKTQANQHDFEAFQDRLTIHQIENTTLATIAFKAPDPIVAADAVNGLIAQYRQTLDQQKQEQFREAVKVLSDRLEILREDVRKTEVEFQERLEKRDLPLPDAGDADLDKMQSLSRDIKNAREALAETEMILQKLDETIQENGFLKNVPYYADTPVFDDLRMIEAELDAANDAYEGQDDSAERQRLKKETDAFQEVLNKEVAEYIETLKLKRSIEKAEIRRMEDELLTLKEDYQQGDNREDVFSRLLDETDTSRAVLESFNLRYQKEIESLNNNNISIRVIAEAVPPQSPDDRHIILIIVGGFGAGFIVGLIVAFIAEYFSHIIQSPRQLEKITGFPVYGLLPKVKSRYLDKAASFILNNPSSMAAESVRSLYTSFQVRDSDKRGGSRVLTFTSTYSGEGKTTSAIWLATIAAQNGKKTLIIDADMRSPAIHQAYGIGNAKGLVDFLSDRLPLDETIYKNHTSGVHIMTGKSIPTYAVMLLANARLENMMRRLRDMYDLIIIDAPTSLLFSDSRLLARFSDKILYTTAWRSTDFPNLMNGLKQFTDMNYNEIAFVMNKIDHTSVMTYNKALQKDLNYFDNR